MPKRIYDGPQLYDQLSRLDERYRALPPRNRTPENLREIAKAYLREIQKFIPSKHDAFTIAGMILEALLLADDRKLHPLFSQPDRLSRARPLLTIWRAQAVAAATLEYACKDFHAQQSAWASKIIRTLDKHGLEGPGNAYSPDALIKWRKACAVGTHKESKTYTRTLNDLRASCCRPDDALVEAIKYCQSAFGHTPTSS